MSNLIAELKRRNVFRVAVAYLIVTWLVLQLTDVLAPAMRLPEWTMSFVFSAGIGPKGQPIGDRCANDILILLDSRQETQTFRECVQHPCRE